VAIASLFLPPQAGASAQFAPVYESVRGRCETIDDFAPAPQINGSARSAGAGFQDWHRSKALARLAEQQEVFGKLIEGLQCACRGSRSAKLIPAYIIITQLDLFTAKSVSHVAAWTSPLISGAGRTGRRRQAVYA